MNLSDIRILTRYIIEDNQKSGKDIFTYDADNIFTLTESAVVSVSSVFKNGTELSSGEWSYDSSTNKVTVTASLSSGDAIEIQYTYYSNYSNTEIENYVRVAITYLSVFNYYTFEIEADGDIWPEPEENEKHLLAMITAILMKPDNKSYRLPDMSIIVPRGSLPTRDMIQKTVAIFKRNASGIFEIVG